MKPDICFMVFKFLSTLLLVFCFNQSFSQKIDSIYINLYTDSLKKGTFNYINVDGLLSNGRYMPLDSTKIKFTCNGAAFSGNSLFIPQDMQDDKVSIRVALKADEKMYKEFDIYIKKAEDPPLKNESEILAEIKANRKKKKG